MSLQLSLFKGRRQRGLKPPPAKEFATHVMVADLLRKWGTRGWRWTHFPSGEKRNIITGARLKRMGVARGWPDFILLAPYPPKVHFLEIKRRGAHLSDVQQDMQMFCAANNYTYAVADTFDDALALLRDWGAVRATTGATP